MLFNPENMWLYGNLSPLMKKEDVEGNKKNYVLYVLKTNKVIKEKIELSKKIADHYKINLNSAFNVEEIENKIRNLLRYNFTVV
jgi:hypothetical protein